MQSKTVRSTQSAQAGFSILEVVIAASLMTVGLLGVTQLFISTTLLNMFSTSTSQSLAQAERQLEIFRVTASIATSQAAVDDVVKSSLTEAVAGAVDSRVAVYVIDNNGNLFPSGTSITLPADLGAVYGPGQTRAPSVRTRLAIIRLTPNIPDPKVSQVVTLVSTIEMKESY
jgi:hypothetical protein